MLTLNYWNPRTKQDNKEEIGEKELEGLCVGKRTKYLDKEKPN